MSVNPREKLLANGANQLTNAELLAILLRTGTYNIPVLDYAQLLIDKFGSLNALLGATPQTLSNIKGIGSAKLSTLKALLELAKRSYLEKLKTQPVVGGAKDAIEFLLMKMKNFERETFACLFLDAKQHLLEYQELFKGTVDQVDVYPREIARLALHLNACHVIAAHNHPSGDTTPSTNDIVLTEKIKQALDVLDITLNDHFIIANNQCQSMAQLGLL